MAKFITIGYGDQEGYNRTSKDVRAAAHAHDSELVRMGALIGIAGPPAQVRNPEGQAVETVEGSEKAIELVSQTPCAVAHGVVEAWPLETIS